MSKFRALLAALVAAVAFSVTAAPASADYPSVCPNVLVQYGCQPSPWGGSGSYINWANAQHALVFNALPNHLGQGYLWARFRQYVINNWGWDPASAGIQVFGKTSTYNHGSNRVHAEAWIGTKYGTGDGGNPFFQPQNQYYGGIVCHVSGDMSGTDFAPTYNLVQHTMVIHGCASYNNWYQWPGTAPAPMM